MKKLFTLLVLTFILFRLSVFSQQMPQLGIASSLAHDDLLYQSGFRFIGASVSSLISPKLTEAEFLQNIALVKNARCKVYMCNIFFPGELKIAGDQVDEQLVLTYAKTVFSRASRLGIPAIILGSGSARRLPEGYDVKKAEVNFVKLAKKLAKLAKQYHVKIFLESLNSTETNFITSLKQASSIVKAVDHPNFRLNADIYHMLKENESPQSILDAGDVIEYCEIAEKEGRTYPGFKGDNFVPYLQALKAINYKGYIFIEGNWTDLKVEAPKAKAYLEAQLKEAYQ